MVIYYKATNVDAMSFHADEDGFHVRYAIGESVCIPKARRKAKLCSSGVLHASDTPSETLIGGEWPCRLFEVTGEPVVGPEGHKLGFYELHVEREIEAWRALGPNGREVAVFIATAKSVNAEHLRGVVAAWAVRDAVRDAARYAARAAAWGVAWDAARDAALALCARDLITAEQFDLLYAPWKDCVPVESLAGGIDV